MNKRACIVYISSRDKCIEHSLKSLWENYNKNYDYPVYVHYFDEIYDSEEFRSKIRNSCSQKVSFIRVPYKTPEFIQEGEMYYNRNELWYSKTNFPKTRKGYLHMCNFTSNMYGYPETLIHNHQFVMTHDDESGYDNLLYTDPFGELEESGYKIGAFFVGQRLRDGSPHQGHLDTRVNLWQFTRKFVIDNQITPKSQQLKKVFLEKDPETAFHYIDWCDTYVIKNEVFESDIWKKWIDAVNQSGGIYKYRWGDNEIISLFAHLIQDKIYDFGTVKSGVHNQGKFRHLQDYAPGVKDLEA